MFVQWDELLSQQRSDVTWRVQSHSGNPPLSTEHPPPPFLPLHPRARTRTDYAPVWRWGESIPAKKKRETHVWSGSHIDGEWEGIKPPPQQPVFIFTPECSLGCWEKQKTVSESVHDVCGLDGDEAPPVDAAELLALLHDAPVAGADAERRRRRKVGEFGGGGRREVGVGCPAPTWDALS